MKRYRRAAAMGAAAEMLKDRREYIRAMEQRKLDHLTTEGAKRKKAVLDARVKFQNAADYLTSKGMDEDKVVSVFMSNPEEGMLLAKAAQDQELKGNTISSEILNRAVTVAQGFEPGKLSVSEAIERITPVFSQSKDPVAQERGMWASIFESGPAAVNRKIAQASLYGVSGADVQASLGSPLYSAAPGTDKAAIDIGSFVKGTKGRSPAEIALIQDRMFDDYDNNLNVELSTLLGKGNDATPAEVKRRSELVEIQKLPKSDRVAALIQDPQFGPAIANKYFTMEPKVFTAAEFGMSAFDAVSSYEAPSEEGEPTVKSDGSIDQSSASGAASTTVTSTNSAGLNVNEAGTPVFESEEEAKAAVESNQIKATTDVIIAGQEATLEIPSLSERFSGRFDIKPDLSVEDRIKAKREATDGVVESIGSAVENVTSKLEEIDNALDVVVGNAVLGTRSKANTALGALAQIAGNDELADSFYRVSVEAEDGSRKGVRFDQGLVTGINEILDNLGVPDYSKVKDEPDAVNQYVDDPVTSGRDLDADLGVGYEPANTRLFSTMDRLKKLRLAINEAPEDATPEAVLEAVAKPTDYEAALDRAPEHIEKLGGQAMDAWRRLTAKLSEYQDVAQDTRAGLADKPKTYTKEEILEFYDNYKKGKESVEMEKRIRDDARQFLQDEKSFPQPLPRIVIDNLVEEAPEVVARAVGTVQTKTRAPLGDTRADPNAEITLDSAVSRSARPSGLMAPPSRNGEPKVGDITPSLVGTVKRLHGSGSKVTKDFQKKVSSGKIKAADVTRLIKDTQKLPRSDSRQELLASLYELRDTLTKR